MKRFSQRLGAAFTVLALAGCGSPQPPKAAPAVGNSPDAQEQLFRLVERYWEEHLPVRAVISPQLLADSLAVEHRYLSEVAALPRDALDENSRLTYDIFKRSREVSVEGFTYPAELMPLGSFGGVLQSVELSSAESAQRPWSTADYELWLKHMHEYVKWTQQAIQNMREGVRRGYVSPRAVIERSMWMLERPAADTAANVFRIPLRSLPAAIGDPEGSRLKNAVANAVDSEVLPATRALHDFLQHEYLPHGRAGLALTDLPLGEKWYAYDVQRATGASLGPDAIHAIGVAEVQRLRSHSPPDHDAVASSTLSSDELLKAYQELASQVDTAMMPLFADSPSPPLEIQGTEFIADARAALLYRPGGLTGNPAAVLYVNVSPLLLRSGKVNVASFLQQALPGHHLQARLAQQRVDLPKFRRMDDDPGFVEGWGLYAASLGEQLGLPTDEASKAEALLLQLHCAVGLVVDTGLHAEGWTRKQALEYLHSELPIDDAGAQALVESYAANPADALACAMGELKFASLRAKAQQVLGSRFDIRAFHAAVLQDGAMPLDILEAKMKIWMDAAR